MDEANCNACTWPEQEACEAWWRQTQSELMSKVKGLHHSAALGMAFDEWWQEHRQALKEAVTKPRLAAQNQAAEEAEKEKRELDNAKARERRLHAAYEGALQHHRDLADNQRIIIENLQNLLHDADAERGEASRLRRELRERERRIAELQEQPKQADEARSEASRLRSALDLAEKHHDAVTRALQEKITRDAKSAVTLQEQIAERNHRIEQLTEELRLADANHISACQTIAKMHEGAVGKAGEGPKRGVVEDVEDLRAKYLECRKDLQEMTAKLERGCWGALDKANNLLAKAGIDLDGKATFYQADGSVARIPIDEWHRQRKAAATRNRIQELYSESVDAVAQRFSEVSTAIIEAYQRLHPSQTIAAPKVLLGEMESEITSLRKRLKGYTGV